MCWGCLAAFEDAPEEVDVTVFEAEGRQAAAICQAAAELVAGVRSWHFPQHCFKGWAPRSLHSNHSKVLRATRWIGHAHTSC